MRGLLTIIVLFGWSLQATAVTITFNEFPAGNYQSGLDTDGYTFTGGLLAETTLGSDGMAYGCAQLASSGCPSLAFERTNGALFTLVSLDLAAFNADYFSSSCHDGPPGCVVETEWARLTGYSDFGVEYTYNLSGPDQNFGTPAVLNWTGLSSVSFSAVRHDDGIALYQFGMDNVVVSAVPIPAAVWLFGSALAGLGFLRRRYS